MSPRRLGLVACLAVAGCLRAPRSCVDRRLEAEIARIRAVDHHAHPERVTAEGEMDVDVDPVAAGPSGLLPPFPLPVGLRADHPRFAAARRALFGASADGPGLEEARRRVRHAQGAGYPAWVLDQLGTETMFANRIALGTGIAAPRFRWVTWADPLLFPLGTAALRRQDPEHAMYAAGEESVFRRYLGDLGLRAPPATLDDYLAGVVVPTMEKQRCAGAVAVKFEAAYLRPLDFEPAPASAARRIYSHSVRGGEPSAADYRTLQNFLFREIARAAGRLGLAVHVHTGAGAGAFFDLEGSNPARLESVLDDPSLRDTTFVFVHGGWPFEKETAFLLGKPNVYADFSAQTFLHSPTELAAVLRLWLGLYPEKVLFGTDAFSLGPEVGWEEVGWACTTNAREALGIALTQMLHDGEITRTRAVELARMVLRDNTLRLYGLDAH